MRLTKVRTLLPQTRSSSFLYSYPLLAKKTISLDLIGVLNATSIHYRQRPATACSTPDRIWVAADTSLPLDVSLRH
jgi:hypothetical protein